MSRIVLVSNRVDLPRRSAPPGGLAVVLADVLKKHACLWFGWSGQINTATETPDIVHRQQTTFATVPMTPDEHREFYLGYSNSVLWPVFHNRLDLAHFGDGYFSRYLQVNERLAKALKPLLEPSDIIWVHDYHFIPLAEQLRGIGIENPIGFFLHIPVPPSQTFLAIPEHVELSRALSAYDLVGLQTQADVANIIGFFEDSVSGRIIQDGRIRVLDRLVSVGAFPVGIDPAEFLTARPTPLLAHGPAGSKRMIGVDRLDYTKGLPEKFRAFGHFLETNPQYRRKVVLTQIAPPTRDMLEAYAEIRATLEGMSGKINGRFGELDWVPIHYIHRNTARPRLRDIYRSSEIGLVTPLRDGMNLVAKEYVASQDPGDPGVLVLSRFAGAAEEMKDALIVNPYDVGEVSDAIRAALEMDAAERIERHAALLGVVQDRDAAAWSASFLKALQRSSSHGAPPITPASADLRRALEIVRKSTARAPAAKTLSAH